MEMLEMGARAMILSMRSGLAICLVLLAMAGPAAGQEIRPTLDKIKETGAVQLGYRETSRTLSFRGMASADDRAKVLKTLETLQAGQDLRVTVFRGDKIVELTTKFTGF